MSFLGRLLHSRGYVLVVMLFGGGQLACSEQSDDAEEWGIGTDTDPYNDTENELDTADQDTVDQDTTGQDSAVQDSDSQTSNQPAELVGLLRDFTDDHADFESALGTEDGIVKNVLGAEQKPVYAGGGGTVTTHGGEPFDQWFRDVAGVNKSMEFKIVLTPGADGVYSYDNQEFFPLDDQLFGNQGRVHNYHFTYELHTEFTYKGGEVFTFTGDDDLWVFINGRLAIDIGGVHGPLSETADLDALQDTLGIEIGKSYPLDFFFAERHTSQSTFRIDTTITDLTPVPVF